MAEMPKNINIDLNFRLDGITLIAAERHRVKHSSSYGDQHDDEHTQCELITAAMAYANQALTTVAAEVPPDYWPWREDDWRPSDDPIRNLVIAGQFIAAEIDRLQRKEARS